MQQELLYVMRVYGYILLGSARVAWVELAKTRPQTLPQQGLGWGRSGYTLPKIHLTACGKSQLKALLLPPLLRLLLAQISQRSTSTYEGYNQPQQCSYYLIDLLSGPLIPGICALSSLLTRQLQEGSLNSQLYLHILLQQFSIHVSSWKQSGVLTRPQAVTQKSYRIAKSYQVGN